MSQIFVSIRLNFFLYFNHVNKVTIRELSVTQLDTENSRIPGTEELHISMRPFLEKADLNQK